MLVIRFFRVGKRNQPSFKIVVTDKRKSSTKGRFVEEVGFYNPLTKEKVLRGERIKYWLSVGVKLSPTVYNLLVSEKIIEGKKIPVHKKSKKELASPVSSTASVTEEIASEKEEKLSEEKPVEEAPKEETGAAEKAEEKTAEEPPKAKEEKSE